MSDRKHPHPMPNCLIAFPIKQETDTPDVQADAFRQVYSDAVMTIHEIDLTKLRQVAPDIAVSQVLELGPIEDPRIGIEVGSLVYYPKTLAIQIGEFDTLSVTNVIAFEDPLD